MEGVGVGDVVREFFEWAFVWGDIDPHSGGLGAGEPDDCTVVVEVRATALCLKALVEGSRPMVTKILLEKSTFFFRIAGCYHDISGTHGLKGDKITAILAARDSN